MKKIINKKLYDTSTATCIAEYSGPARVSDFSFYRETLYRKRTGEYFIHGEGGARSRYASYEYGLMSWGEQILPLTYDTARDWAEHHMDADAYQDEFGPAAEDDSRTVMSLSVRADTADKARRGRVRLQHLRVRRACAVGAAWRRYRCVTEHAVSISLAKCVCIMRKIIVNPRRFSHRKDFRKRREALINKEKPAISMDCWFS